MSLKAQVTPPGQQCLPRSMRAALWWLLPSDGEFQRAPSGNQYYLARQGWRVVLRGGDVTQAGFGSRINWIYDPAPPPPRRTTLHSRDSHVSIPSDRCKNEVSAISSPAPLSSAPPKKRRVRRRRQARRAANRKCREFICRATDPGCALDQSARSSSSRSDAPTAREQRPHISQADGSVPAFPDCR